MVLVIDIGTTHTHLAAVDVYALSCVGRIDFDNLVFGERFAPSVQKILLKYSDIRQVSISSCVKDLFVKARKTCVSEYSLGDIGIVSASEKLQVAFKYDNLHKLGADRVCNALACAKLFQDQSCIIIDSGTAVTIDYLHNGKTFEGGVILPGATMQINALHNLTDALPFIVLRGNEQSTMALPATSTEKCVKAGILYGSAGAVEKCITEYLRIHQENDNNGKCRIVATGGGWESVKTFVNIGAEIINVPDLTLFGAAVYKTQT